MSQPPSPATSNGSRTAIPLIRGGRGRGRGGGTRGERVAPSNGNKQQVTPNQGPFFMAIEWREVIQWPAQDPSARPVDEQRAANAADLERLYSVIPSGPMRDSLRLAAEREEEKGRVIKEMYLATGRRCELVFANAHGGSTTILRSNELVSQEQLEAFLPLFRSLDPSARRSGIDGTLHRISRSMHAVQDQVVAIAARVGRTMQGHALPLLVRPASAALNAASIAEEPSARPALPASEVEAGRAAARLCAHGLVLIGPPNVGKTTVLRELARLLSLGDERVVVVVDKSLEIAGPAIVPHEAIGNARVLSVDPKLGQHRAMIEAVENMSPDFIIVDELSNKDECTAARTITGRGVNVIASVHGDSLAQLLVDPERSVLVGGVQSVTLSAREADQRPDRRRTVQRRYGAPVFGVAVELRGFGEAIVHDDVQLAVDAALDSACSCAWWHRADDKQGVVRARPVIAVPSASGGLGSAYACLEPGHSVSAGTDMHAGQPDNWRCVSDITPAVFVPAQGGPGSWTW